MPELRLTRRSVLASGSAAVATATLASHGLIGLGLSVPARAREPAAPSETSQRLIRRVVRSPENTYFTYPHSNGFLADGRAVLAAPTQATKNSPGLEFFAFDPTSGQTEYLTYVRNTRMYYAIANNGLMLVSEREGAAVVDLNSRNAKPRQILHEMNWTTHGDNDISVDGKWALVTRTRNVAPRNYRTDLVEIATGRIKTIMQPGWQMDHAHFSPFDPNWIAIAANRSNRDPQRMWVWHGDHAPRGRNIFRQTPLSGKFFHVGHERAMFHKPAMLTIAYGTSTATPRGLYEVGFDGTAKLISESNRDLHCNISRDGTWAVVSLQGRYTHRDMRPTADWHNSEGAYGINDVMIVAMTSGKRRFLYRGTHAALGQPYEVQPSISPDQKWVLLKDAQGQDVIFLELDQGELRAFLSDRSR